MYRIVREALTNVSRHAPHARTVTVGITQHERPSRSRSTDDAPARARRYRRRLRPHRNARTRRSPRRHPDRRPAIRRRLVRAREPPGPAGRPMRILLRRRPGDDPRAACGSSWKTSPTSPWSPRRPTASKRSSWPAGCARTCAWSTSRCPASTASRSTRALAGPASPTRGGHGHHVRPGRVRLRRAALRRGRLRAQGRRARPAGRGRAGRAHRRRAHLAVHHLRLLRHLADRGTRTAARVPRSPVRRETEIVRAIGRGRTNQEIAAELFISLSTVKGYVSGIMAKLGVRNRVEVVAWAWESRGAADPRRPAPGEPSGNR